MKILLICPKYNFEGYAPTGLASIAVIAENLGHQVKIVDMNLEKLPKEHYDLIGITGMSLWRKSIIETSKLFPKSLVIVGGGWATIQPEQTLSNSTIDYVCVGEGEITFHEFLKNYPDVDNVQGIGTKHYVNERRPFIENLDTLPFPAWHLLQLQKYKRVSINTSRGCPFKCIFCAVHKFLGRKWRARSVQSVLEEIELLVYKFKVRHITFGDSNLTFKMERFEQICDEIVERKIRTEFDVIQGVRADRLTPRLLKKMKEAGFTEVIIAPESGSQRVLDEVIGKKLDLSCVEPIAKKCKEIGLRLGAFFVVGFPWETMEEIKQTLRFAAKLRSYGCSCYVGNAIPLTGTDLYYQAKAEGYLRFDGEELENQIHYLGLPRKVHCLTSPFWKPEEIIRICQQEGKKNYRAVYGSYSVETILRKFVRHPIRSVRKALKAF